MPTTFCSESKTTIITVEPTYPMTLLDCWPVWTTDPIDSPLVSTILAVPISVHGESRLTAGTIVPISSGVIDGAEFRCCNSLVCFSCSNRTNRRMMQKTTIRKTWTTPLLNEILGFWLCSITGNVGRLLFSGFGIWFSLDRGFWHPIGKIGLGHRQVISCEIFSNWPFDQW